MKLTSKGIPLARFKGINLSITRTQAPEGLRKCEAEGGLDSCCGEGEVITGLKLNGTPK